MKPFPKSEQNETVFKTVIILKVLKRLFNIFVDFGDVKAVCCRDSLFIKRSKNIFKTFLFFTPPARRAWRSYKFASVDFSVLFFFSVSKVGLPLMGYTAVHSCLSHYF